MSNALKEKLKIAKQKKIKQIVKDDIIKVNALNLNDVDFIDIHYQKLILEIKEKGIYLIKNNHDINSQYGNYQKFIEQISSKEKVFLYCSGADMFFFVSVPSIAVKANPKYFWESHVLHCSWQSRFFIDSEKKYGFAALNGEYGIEVCQWY